MADNAIGQFIAALRKANGMTQQEVADRLHVSNKAVSRWERGECAPDLYAIPALAEMFDVTCDELLKGERNKENRKESAANEKKEAKVDKQVKSLINRTLSDFKTLVWISMAVAMVGLICMFGISYGCYRPVIGFAVMLLLEVVALVLAVTAVSRTKDVKRDNELFEKADEVLLERFYKILGEYSFWAFYMVISSIILTLPFVLNTFEYGVESVMNLYSYATTYFAGIVMVLLLVYMKCKQSYMTWITDGELVGERRDSSMVSCNRMTWIQIGLTVIMGIALVIFNIYETDEMDTLFWNIIYTGTGIGCMVANVAVFVVYLVKYKEERERVAFLGLRNLLLIPAAFIAANAYQVGWVTNEDAATSKRFYMWIGEYLFFAVVYCMAVFLVFSLLENWLKRKKIRHNCRNVSKNEI